MGRWRCLLRRQAASGLSVSAFCRRWRISQPSFYVWRRKLRDDGGPTEQDLANGAGRKTSNRAVCDAANFVEVCLSPEASPAADPLELILPRGHRILVRRGFDRATLQALVDALDRHGAVVATRDRHVAVVATQERHAAAVATRERIVTDGVTPEAGA